jgi:hypothetical protein
MEANHCLGQRCHGGHARVDHDHAGYTAATRAVESNNLATNDMTLANEMLDIPSDTQSCVWRILSVGEVVGTNIRDGEIWLRLIRGTDRTLGSVIGCAGPWPLAGLMKAEEISSNTEFVITIVNMCSSFLTIQEDHVYLIHQSAKDYLSTNVSTAIFPAGPAEVNYRVFSRSLQVLLVTLRRDIYNEHSARSIKCEREKRTWWGGRVGGRREIKKGEGRRKMAYSISWHGITA